MSRHIRDSISCTFWGFLSWSFLTCSSLGWLLLTSWKQLSFWNLFITPDFLCFTLEVGSKFPHPHFGRMLSVISRERVHGGCMSKNLYSLSSYLIARMAVYIYKMWRKKSLAFRIWSHSANVPLLLRNPNSSSWSFLCDLILFVFSFYCVFLSHCLLETYLSTVFCSFPGCALMWVYFYLPYFFLDTKSM